MRLLFALCLVVSLGCPRPCPDGRCAPTPMDKKTLLPGEEGEQREAQTRLAHDVRGTQVRTAQMLAKLPESLEVLERREHRRRDEGASTIVTSVDELVLDRTAAIALGKALFWDTQVGSDSQTACATCHSHFGADARQARGSFGVALRSFLKLEDSSAVQTSRRSRREVSQWSLLDVEEGEPNPSRTMGADDRARSPKKGKVARQRINQLNRERPEKAGVDSSKREPPTVPPNEDSADRKFMRKQLAYELARQADAGINRLLTDRSAPTVHGATWFDRLFFDGRARSVFNGYDILGDDAFPDFFGKWRHGQRVLVRIPHAALASQAIGPLVSLEMSWVGRMPSDVARKLLSATVLEGQLISPTDSHLARCDSSGTTCVGADGRFTLTYEQLIAKAFKPEWCTSRVVGQDLAGEQLTECEANFSALFGVAVMLYEQQLTPDDTPFDRHFRGDGGILSDAESAGLQVFTGAGCDVCHGLPESSSATRSHAWGPLLEFEVPDAEENATDENDFVRWLVAGSPAEDHRVEWMRGGAFRQSGEVPYDKGFYNLGLTAAADDPGIGFGLALEATPRTLPYFQRYGVGRVPSTADGGLPAPPALTLVSLRFHEQAFVRGAFKTPHLRNVVHTAPWFHYGGKEAGERLLKAELVRVYCMRNLRRPPLDGKESVRSDVHPAMTVPTDQWDCGQIEDLVAFLGALTDERATRRSAPFDHPALRIPCTPEVSDSGVTVWDAGSPLDLPAVGAAGTDAISPRCR